MGNLANVWRLLEEGAAVNGKNIGGSTPLMVAAHTGQPEMVRLLLSFGAGLDLTDDLEMTARQHVLPLAYGSPKHSEVLAILENHKEKAS